MVRPGAVRVSGRVQPPAPPYAELAVTTNFSFLRGASHPQEMVAQAAEFGLRAIGIADRNTLAGVVRGYGETKRRVKAGNPSIAYLAGVRLVTREGFEAVTYPMDRDAYGRLCRLLTNGNRRSRKGQCDFGVSELLDASPGQIF
ncbi:MAG: PHP domain-containing protein, partial [Methylobacterium sp.]|uniref:PHP domain-containing protein n=1 Tax=Methylobacterium sp. TaxID=409 RepID=UPI0025D80805